MKITESSVRKIIREELLRLIEQEDPKPEKLDDLDFKSSERIAYEDWANLNGYVSSEVRSTLVAYFVDQKLQDSHDLHDKLAKEFGFKHDDIMRDLGTDTEESETEESEKILDLQDTIRELASL
jgi:hypothetical protein